MIFIPLSFYFLFKFKFIQKSKLTVIIIRKEKMDESAKKKLTFRGNLISILDNVEWINEDLEQRSWPCVRKMS